ncbi:MAG: hypothetical protein GJ680_14220 [Alteromonadaceae bacterium]|nr:hypothetical protein [Alteromonadaceae bacterium]
MKKAIIIFIEIALLWTVLQTSFVQHLLNDTQSDVSDWLADVTGFFDSRSLAGLRQNIAPFTESLDEPQRAYLEDVTNDLQKLQNFNNLYCKGDDKNPFVYGETLQILCAQIASSEVLRRS